MKTTLARLAVLVAVAVCVGRAGNAFAQRPEPPKVEIPNAGVPQAMTIEGAFVRASYDSEAFVILGYKVANASVGTPWMLLEVGATVLRGAPNQTLTRESFSLTTPDNQAVPLPSNQEYLSADLAALRMRANVIHDSIDYFPLTGGTGCEIGFFSDVEVHRPSISWDSVELNWTRNCVGRLYFHVPGNIRYGQYWLNVRFQDSLIRVPFRILTKDEEEALRKNYKSIRQQVKDAFPPPKKEKE